MTQQKLNNNRLNNAPLNNDPLNNDPLNNDHAAADALHEYIRERQADRAPAMLVDPDDAATADTLLLLTQQTVPEAGFVADLEKQLVAAAQANMQITEASHHWLLGLRQRLGSLMPTRLPMRRWAMVGASAAFILAILLFAVPTTRAAILNRLYALAFVEEAALQVATIPVVEPAFVPHESGPMTLDEIRTAAPFAVPTPAWLPDGLQFTGGYVIHSAEGAQVSLVYHPSMREIDLGSPVLLLLVARGEVNAPPVLPVEYAQIVEVSGQPASYLHGGWRGQGGGAPGTTITDATWDATLDMQWLSWRAGDGLTYLLQADGLGLTVADVIRSAESLE